jgi:Arc/MetJ-type ribon-helix-helix transcriptional regulator
MKVSVSLPAGDVAFLDRYAEEQGLSSRSAAIHQAVRSLQQSGLSTAYDDAFGEWEQTDDTTLWEMVAADGLEADAPG